MPDTNNHQGWKATEQFRVPLGISQQLRAFTEACKSTFLSSSQILQTPADFHKSQFFWITCQVIYCKTRFSSVMKRKDSQLDAGWPAEGWCSEKKHTDKGGRQANWHLNRGRDGEKTGHHSRLPVPKKQRRHTLPRPGSVQSACIAHGWSLSLDSDSPILPVSVFFFSCKFYLGQRLLSCHVSPRCLYRLSWLPSQSMAPTHVRPLLHQRRGGSNP